MACRLKGPAKKGTGLGGGGLSDLDDKGCSIPELVVGRRGVRSPDRSTDWGLRA